MLVVISPAKTLDFNNINETLPMTNSKFLKEAKILVEELKNYDSYSLGKLMKTSDKLSLLNKNRFDIWNESFDNSRQCLIAFKGEVFKGID
ncbi:YaaA family protein, partial [Clostridium botulinum]|nr:YaaA family protein [Clostridium botulinum]